MAEPELGSAMNEPVYVQSSESLDTRDRNAVIARLMAALPADTVFDVGAYQGLVAANYLTVFSRATIYAFEPHPATFSILSEKYAREPRVVVENLAVSDRIGISSFHLNRISATSSLLPRATPQRRYYSAVDRLEQVANVQTTTIDDYCRQHRIDRINLLKLDIQGGERRALQGATSMLQRNTIDVIFSEVFFVPHYERAYLFHELWADLEPYGYSLYDLFLDRYGRNGQLRFGDAIFVSRRVRRDVLDAVPDEP